MAVNPKIIMMAAQTAKNPKVRRAILNIVLISLGLIMMIFVVFTGLISGLLAIIENNDLKNHWSYYRTSISELFNGIVGEINTDVKSEVYDFMPDFSVNLSKAAIANNFDGSSLILYDEDEISRAETIMKTYAGQLRNLTTQDALIISLPAIKPPFPFRISAISALLTTVKSTTFPTIRTRCGCSSITGQWSKCRFTATILKRCRSMASRVNVRRLL